MSRSWYRFINWTTGKMRFPNFMAQNGCAVIALGNLADMDVMGARRLYEAAKQTPNAVRGDALLNKANGAVAMLIEENLQAWAKLAGLTIGKRIRTVRSDVYRAYYKGNPGYIRRMQVKTLLQRRMVKKGRYLVTTNGHVFAVIDGEPYGDYNPKAYVEQIVAVTLTQETV